MPFERESSDVCENSLARKFLEGRWTEAPIGKGADREARNQKLSAAEICSRQGPCSIREHACVRLPPP